jgi:quercetin 2,3-dioxygenase
MVSDVHSDAQTSIKINQDANIYVSEIDPNSCVSLDLAAGRQGYLLLIEGSAEVSVSGQASQLDRHDSAEVFGPSTITVSSQDQIAAHILLVEMAYTGKGRRDLDE